MKKIDPGRIGLMVARNVRRYRADMSYAELSRRLTNLGRPIPPLGLRHLEAGQRRIDVDDLVMLAFALEVSPIMLLAGTDTEETLLLLMGGAKGLGQEALIKEVLAGGND